MVRGDEGTGKGREDERERVGDSDVVRGDEGTRKGGEDEREGVGDSDVVRGVDEGTEKG